LAILWGELMNKLFVRSRGLLVILTLTLATAMCTVSTASAASAPPSAGSKAGARTADTSPSSVPCNLRHTISKCQSTNPTVTVSTYAYGGTGGIVDCSFAWTFIWGDGHSTSVTLTDPHVGWRVTAQHKYAKPGVYTMTATGEAIGTNCTLTPFIVTFTLLASSPPPSSCPTALLLGLHGMNEGPSDKMPKVSATLAETFAAFRSDTIKRGDKGVKTDALSYKTVTIEDFSTLNGVDDVDRTVNGTAISLLTDLQAFTKQCPSMRILLAGYSMGAWIINDLLTQMLAAGHGWPNIKAIQLYGDPCWYSNGKSGSHKGLAREALPDTCVSKSTYPYPAASSKLPFKVRTSCNDRDPICGEGFSSINDQLKFVKENCNYSPSPSKSGACPHFNYEVEGPARGATAQGAKFLAQYA
jgi:cutinase